ncbi:MAG: hypothetical protein NXI24_14660 [bacterium]|nr:hypothetical protein [bacterium]
MPLFTRDDSIQLRFKGRQITGSLIYEKSRELAIRTVPFSEGREVQLNFFENLRDTFGRDKVYAEYRRGNYLCTFETHMIGAEPDASCHDGSIIVNLEVPGRVKRVIQATS